MRIGIAYTTHNRYDSFKNSLTEMKKYFPKGAKLVIVDDASDIPVKEADYRFEQNVGIATAKNKCLELLDDCDHIFLFDDDTYPRVDEWWQPYIDSPEPHLCYIFLDLVNQKLNDSRIIYRDDSLVAYSHPRGCMFYVERRVLDVTGGMDTRYMRWGFEHVDLSNRIYNHNLTSFRYQDVPGSSNLFYSGDEQMTVTTTVPAIERREYLARMRPHYQRSFSALDYCDYKVDPNRSTEHDNNVVLTAYFCGQPDPQRNMKWDSDIDEAVAKLAESIAENSQNLVVLTDILGKTSSKENVEYVPVQASLNPYFQRWLSYWQYLRAHPEIDNVFCVDATDVEMLRPPFKQIEPIKLYVGDEKEVLGCTWMLRNHRIEPLLSFIRRHRDETLLNAGIVGGSRKTVMDFIHAMIALYFDNNTNIGSADMGAFNFVARNKFGDRLVHGKQINTVFKGYEPDNGISWWRHK